ncbi:glycosyltransferase family 4 protein [Aestuariicoccus sp. MJ-SS9]|uniref:glycosyltransferase family 4 protein n=1 Tax=Aestuariicoccus sp. MJ-SS9 TaxID=3079855 RepID=UPI00291163E7|nr:glycosyltransferase family 4 protein [Aestuariicoccus sp. MJ-SS9]MDU8914137.1 glycosyltransferase family 4 protein [Aestuariicoccus sp. MJ-SS9]
MADQRPLRIAYLCDFSPLNRNLYSGGNARIYDALRQHAGEVTILPQSWHAAEPLRRLMHAMPEGINLRARWRLHLALAPLIARGVSRELARGRYDVLFGAYSFHSLYRVKPPYPMVTAFTSDATQTVYRNSEIGNWHKSYLRAGRLLDDWIERCETRVLQNADLLLWPSQWLKDAADRRYGLTDETSKLVPWGANLNTPAPRITPTKISRQGPVRLLLIGRNWFAKGGPIAFDTMTALRANGIDARLTVIGCKPPKFHRTEHVTVLGALDKAVPDQLALFEKTFDNAHFLIQPSYESYGFAFCEASAYGVPSLCLRVGGVPIREGVNGHALPLGSTPADFAAVIERYLDDPAGYWVLGQSTRREFEDRLNWDSWGRRTAALLHDKVTQFTQENWTQPGRCSGPIAGAEWPLR